MAAVARVMGGVVTKTIIVGRSMAASHNGVNVEQL